MTTPTPTSTPTPMADMAIELPAARIRELPITGLPGVPMAVLGLLALAAGVALIGWGFDTLTETPRAGIPVVILGFLVLLAATGIGAGLTPVAPGEARVLQFLGRYTGTVREPGLRWVNPLTTRRRVSTRVRNHETTVLKVNEADGNPIEIAAVVVWRVDDTARAVFEVDDFVTFVAKQTETAVRHIAGSYPYDARDTGQLSLRDSADEITEQLSREVAARVELAGVTVIESRMTHLAYAPEIAQAMLRRQQANAVVAARQRIVEGAVGMVEMALDRLSAHEVVDLDEERKAAMVSNLLVVLCGDRDAQPVVNSGSLYH